MKYEDARSETPFATRDNMLDIRKELTELCYRGFGLRKRKPPKIPKNISTWSEESQQRWLKGKEAEIAWQEQCDRAFIKREADYLLDTCRTIVNLIDSGNTMEPYTVK